MGAEQCAAQDDLDDHVDDDQDRLADCESGKWDRLGRPIAGTANWASHTARYEGGVHFAPATWDRYRPAAFPGAARTALDADPLLDAILRGELDPADAEAVDSATDATRGSAARRPLIVGGAITSAAISIVGVAYVAWRASRPAPVRSNRAMARAARAARARRATGTAIVTGTAIIAALGVPA